MKTFTKVIMMATALAFITLACSGFSSPKQKKLTVAKSLPDTLISAQLGKTLSEILLNPTSVTMYSVKGKEETKEGDFVLEPHYVRDSLYGVLSTEAVAILEFTLIANAENYKSDSVLVRSPYLPQFEFEFAKKKQIAHVLVSMSDFSWTVIYDGKKQFNFNYADKETIERFFDLMLKRED